MHSERYPGPTAASTIPFLWSDLPVLPTQAFSELLEHIYMAPLMPERWTHVLNLLCAQTGSRNFFLLCSDSRPELAVHAMGGPLLHPGVMRIYAERYAGKDVYRLPLLRNGKTGLLNPDAIVPREKLLSSGMYRDCMGVERLQHPGLVVLACSLERLEVMSYWRTEDEGPMPEEGEALLRLLLPHLTAAMHIRHVLGVTVQQRDSAVAVADASATATFLIGDDMRLLHCNLQGRKMLDTGDALQVVNDCIRTATPHMQKPLRAMLEKAGGNGWTTAGGQAAEGLRLERNETRGGRGRAPIQLLGSRVMHQGQVAVLLLAADPGHSFRISQSLLRNYFALTAAEGNVVQGLLTGYTPQEIAILRKVSTGTVRQQLKSIFAKTGTRNQANLIRTIMAMPRLEQSLLL